jgi:hypothetical protein|tara:strand:+ start:1094 stop:1225 length:132 start_codon:yes stop_codon:yes gene_type:complete
MSWILTQEQDTDFEMEFDTLQELVDYTHSVDSETEISWISEEQ